MLVNGYAEGHSGGSLLDGLAVHDAPPTLVIPQSLLVRARGPVLLYPTDLDILGRARRIKSPDLLRDVLARGHVVHHEADEALVEVLEALGGDGRVLGALPSGEELAAPALEIDPSRLGATDLEDVLADGDVGGVDDSLLSRGVEGHGEGLVHGIASGGQRGGETVGSVGRVGRVNGGGEQRSYSRGEEVPGGVGLVRRVEMTAVHVGKDGTAVGWIDDGAY
eukprot:CAMPEP_0172535552 /NCGR_PEP_ID=MMETSP1067-20121228/7507_1 /TAXON_ID=265564 ORGANISM="Thalassiosira punctigera, Strain Tpunct2005C2" /NCGR_SAMPLE_ID=MMETSP1067 /ASSEMBLY_ACC=CAM_ASM_000444 /LENGTH=221 /DNA_ID=CAMNT_0013320489 /DNA_START=372 /DNA_END=1035 /DNA_ORIENTATION=-